MQNLKWLHVHAKRNYYTRAVNDAKNNPKNMWNTINKLTNKKSKTTAITKLNISNENVTEDPNEMSHTFNTYFNTIGENLANELNQVLLKRLNPMLLLVIQLFKSVQNVSEVDLFH